MMKIAIKITIFMLALAFIVVPTVACGGTAQPPKITLADSSTVLDMSSELPACFERLDAAAEGFSNDDLELGSDFSEIELFFCEDPHQQIIFAYLGIIESKVEQASMDEIFQDEQQLKSLIIEGMQLEATEEDVELANVDMDITYPDIGDVAVLGSGTMTTYGENIRYDFLVFRSNTVYVFVASVHLSEEGVSLIPVAEGIEQRIGMFSQ